MGLFGLGKKKKEEEMKETPMPSAQSVPPLKFPEMGEIKKAVKPSAAQPIQLEQPKPFLQPMTPIQMGSQTASQPASVSRLRVTREIDDTIEPREQRTPIQAARTPAIAKLKEPIFVKIDKFEDALLNFEEIKKRLHESFELLEKIKRIRGKEEEEVDAWEKEIEEIKSRMFELDKNLFSRVEF